MRKMIRTRGDRNLLDVQPCDCLVEMRNCNPMDCSVVRGRADSRALVDLQRSSKSMAKMASMDEGDLAVWATLDESKVAPDGFIALRTGGDVEKDATGGPIRTAAAAACIKPSAMLRRADGVSHVARMAYAGVSTRIERCTRTLVDALDAVIVQAAVRRGAGTP